jgi:hypothetical protein
MPDAAAIFWLVVLCGGAALFVTLRMRQSNGDEARRQEKAAAYEARVRQKEDALVLRDLDGYFPALAPRWKELVDDGADSADALYQAIDETPGVVVGTAFGLPALLADDERRKHLYVVGKTGSGKTTLLLNLIKADLAARRGVGVIAPEAELFRDWLLPMIPEERAEDVIYFAPGNPKNPVTFNPLAVEDGEDQGRASEELFSIFKRALGEGEFGARMTPIIGNAFACLTGRPGATLWDVKRLLEDATFRKEVVDSIPDDYQREFWINTFPQFPKGSHLPIVNRLDQFLRPLQVRQALCHPESGFSVRRALDEGQLLLFDLSGLAPDSMLLLGQMLLSKFQLELMRRERLTQEERRPFYLYADEFQTFAGVSEGTWRELLSRGRRYGLALTLAHQYPSQLPEGLRDEIFGNVASLVAFGLSAHDAQVVRKELLELPLLPVDAQPVSLEALVTLRTGEAITRLGSGGYGLKLRAADPVAQPKAWRGERTREMSWRRFGTSAFDAEGRSSQQPSRKSRPTESFLE